MKQTVATVTLLAVAALVTAGPAEDQLRDELALPALGQGPWSVKLDFTNTPLSGKYSDPGVPVVEYRKAIREARILLWGSASGTPPRDIQSEVAAVRRAIVAPPLPFMKGARPPVKGMGPSPLLRTSFTAPPNAAQEKQFKAGLEGVNREIARLIAKMEQSQEGLEKLYETRAKECPRWQAHHSLVTAALTLRICYLNEYSLAMGQMRKDFPERDPSKHKGWRLAPSESMQDAPSKKLLRTALKSLEELSKDHPGTAWDQVAAELRKTPLSVTFVAE